MCYGYVADTSFQVALSGATELPSFVFCLHQQQKTRHNFFQISAKHPECFALAFVPP
jgi:hypothetical protein